MLRTTHFLLLSSLLLAKVTSGQLVINNTQTATDLVQNTLLGGGVAVSNITFNGLAGNAVYDQLAAFNSANANVGIGNGLMLTTGDAQVALGPNNSDAASIPTLNSYTDIDLQALASGTIHDAAVLEFDFVPSGNQISFNFVFASEEYLEFVNLYNDVFGFFLSGPGIAGPYSNGADNIALIPGTNTPVSINTLNSTNYPNYYVDNGDGFTAPFNSDPAYIQFDGMTSSITASATVQCGQQYHIKLAVGDALDAFYDSGVFLQANAFSSPTMNVSVTPDLNLPCSGTADLSILSISGGIPPYSTTWSYNGSVVSTAQTITVQPGATGTYTATVTDGCGGTMQQQVIVSAPLSPPMTLTLTPDLYLPCAGTLDVEVLNLIGGTAPFTHTWTLNGNVVSTAASYNVQNNAPGTYTMTVTDGCGGSVQGSVVVSQAPQVTLALSVTPDLFLPCQGQVALSVLNVSGGSAPYTYNWTLNGTNIGSTQTIQIPAGSPGNYAVAVTDGCNGIGTASVLVSPPNVAPITVTTTGDVTVACTGNVATVTVTSTTGGDGQYIYTWNDANGNVAGTGDLLSIPATTNSTYTLSVTDGCNGNATTTVNVLVPEPLQLNLPATAVVCQGMSVELHAQPIGGSGAGTYTYSWSPMNDTTGSVTVFPQGDTTFTVDVTDACGSVVLGAISILVEIPEVKIHSTNISGDEFKFTAQCDPSNASFAWDFSSGGSAFGNPVQNTFAGEDIYWAMVTATTVNGCTDTDSLSLTPASQVFFPNAFTPDGDGINDGFGPVGFKLEELELIIFDRWGAEVFSTNSPDGQWNGRMSNGEPAPTGVYVYKYRASGERLNVRKGMGSVTLLGQDTAAR